jgi:SAM-dependent methyltransferase
MDLRVRSVETELMDDCAVGVAEMRGALADLDRLASFLGGWSASLGPLRDRLAGRKRVRILDVGAGSGAMARVLAVEARRLGVSARIVAADLHPAVCRVAGEGAAAEPAVRVVRADARRLPFADGSFDFSLSGAQTYQRSRREGPHARRAWLKPEDRHFADPVAGAE